MVNNTPTILIIGGPEEPDTFRRYPNITRVRCDGFSLLAGLDDLDTYNVVIYWPTPDVLGIPSPNTAKITEIEMLLIGWEQKSKVRLLDSDIDDIIETAVDSVKYTKGRKKKLFNINLKKEPGFKDRLAHLSINQLGRINNRILGGATILCIVPKDFYKWHEIISREAFAWMPLIDIKLIDEVKNIVTAPQNQATNLAYKLTGYIHAPWQFYFTCTQPDEETLDWYEDIVEKESMDEHLDSNGQFRLHARSAFRLFIPKYYHRKYEFIPGHIDEGGRWKSIILSSPSHTGSVLFIPEVNSLDNLLDIVSSNEEITYVQTPVKLSVYTPAATESPANKFTIELSDKRIPIPGQPEKGWLIICNGKEVVMGYKTFLIFLTHIIAKNTNDIGIDPMDPKLSGKKLSKDIFSPRTKAQEAKPAQYVNDTFKAAQIDTPIIKSFYKDNRGPYYQLNQSVEVSKSFFSCLDSMKPHSKPVAALLKIYDSNSKA